MLVPASTVLPWALAPITLSGWGPPGQKQMNRWRGHRRGFLEEAEAREDLRLEEGGRQATPKAGLGGGEWAELETQRWGVTRRGSGQRRLWELHPAPQTPVDPRLLLSPTVPTPQAGLPPGNS